jgi:hypothetical protein
LLPYLLEVRACLPMESVQMCLVGFNSSKFDNLILIPHLASKLKMGEECLKIGIYGNSVLTYTATLPSHGLTLTTFDIRRHMPGSLRGNCFLWGVPEGGAKGDLDHGLVQTIYNMDPSKFGEFIAANEGDHEFKGVRVPGIRSYCIQDVIATGALHAIYKSSMEFIVNMYTIKRHGASLGMIAMLGDMLAELKARKDRTSLTQGMDKS